MIETRSLPRCRSLTCLDNRDAGSTLLLCSGGVESAVLVGQLLELGEHVVPLFADYSQRGASQERLAAERMCSHFGLEPPQHMDLRAEGGAFQAMNRLHVPMPHRNLVLLSLALAWASTHRCSRLAIGLNKDDFAKVRSVISPPRSTSV